MTYNEMLQKSKKYAKVALIIIVIGGAMNLTNSYVKLDVSIAGHAVSAWIGQYQ